MLRCPNKGAALLLLTIALSNFANFTAVRLTLALV